MSVVSATARRRWAAVLSGTVLLVAAVGLSPRAVGLLARQDAATPSPREVLRQALGSDVPYTALSESRGTLGLPDIPGLGVVAELLGGTTRSRVWWSTPDAWRVDVLTATGERGTYGTPEWVFSWDYERRDLDYTPGEPGARLPRADDLIAPQAVRRLLLGVGSADRVEALPGLRLAGRAARGLRIVPASSTSTIGRADVWVDSQTGLPLRLRLVDRTGADALVSELTELRIGAPPAAVTVPPSPPGVRPDIRIAPDFAAAMDQRAPWALPDSLAGLPATRSLLRGTSTYGSGLVRFVVLPLRGRTASDILANGQSAGAAPIAVDGGTASRVSSSILGVVVAQGDDYRHAYLIAGLVTGDLLERAARELLADPPPPRFQ